MRNYSFAENELEALGFIIVWNDDEVELNDADVRGTLNGKSWDEMTEAEADAEMEAQRALIDEWEKDNKLEWIAEDGNKTFYRQAK